MPDPTPIQAPADTVLGAFIAPPVLARVREHVCHNHARPMTLETDPSRYSEALEQQLALTRRLLSPLGPSLLQDAAGELLVGSDLGKDGRWRAQILAGEVSHAMPFFWTAPIARAIREAVESMPAYTFTEDGFPRPVGFVWFEQPVPLNQGETGPGGLRAISWRVGPRLSGRGVIALLNGWLATSERPDLVLRVRESVDMGWTLEQAKGAAGDALRVAHGTAEPPAVEAKLVDVFLRFVAGCLSFLEQRIVVADRRPPARPLRRRLERERYRGEATIGVIALRRREYASGDADATGQGRDWQHQWIVSGHWRRQFYPASNAHKPRYIAPYLKGPVDKPLKAPDGSVFAVTR